MREGTRLGPYEVVAPLGAGGMGEVYRARDARLGREVAVKVLPESVARDPARLSRFEREAQALAALSHPNILSVFDTGRHDDVTYVVTELLEGETLRERIARERLPWRKAAGIAAGIADGLSAAHGKGIVHRDLKPENVLLTGDGRVKAWRVGAFRSEVSSGTLIEDVPTRPALTLACARGERRFEMRQVSSGLRWACATAATLLAVPPAIAANPVPCADLAGLRIENTNLQSSTVVPAGSDLPEYCRVLGYVRPAINFEIRLPTRAWNSRFLMVGCGGFCGTVDSEQSAPVHSINYGLRRGYAASTTDSGHWGASVADGRWAWNNRLAEIDWAERAVTETARVARAVIEAFYGHPPQRSYFSGCSNGGRMAAMEAQRHPEDFDGIISGCPSLAASSLHLFFTWLVRANAGPDGRDVLSGSKVGVVAGAVLKRCDARDGLEDGILSDPLACDFTPASLACKTAASDSCLTEAEVNALEKWYEGPRNSRGETLYPGGLPRGSEPYWPHWWLTARDPDGPRPALVRLSEDSLRYLAFPDDPGDRYDVSSFDFDLDPPRVRFVGALYDATNPDLSKFKARGGKLLMYQGWADPAVTPQRTVEYHAAVEKAMGGREAVADFYRLFMVPAMGHCGVEPDGPGITATGFDPLTALERWVEQGVAPDSLLTTKTDKEGKTLWTRPVCPHPQVARYDGKGDPKDAASFACAMP